MLIKILKEPTFSGGGRAGKIYEVKKRVDENGVEYDSVADERGVSWPVDITNTKEVEII